MFMLMLCHGHVQLMYPIIRNVSMAILCLRNVRIYQNYVHFGPRTKHKILGR